MALIKLDKNQFATLQFLGKNKEFQYNYWSNEILDLNFNDLACAAQTLRILKQKKLIGCDGKGKFAQYFIMNKGEVFLQLANA